jgi:dihydrofolate reductase
MRNLVVGTFVTLDGVMQAPGGPDEDRDGGFRHGGWQVPYFDERFLGIMTGWTRRAGAFLLGRKTYQMFAASWPRSTDPADEIATALNTRPKFVASRTLDTVTWNNSHLLRGRSGLLLRRCLVQRYRRSPVGGRFSTMVQRRVAEPAETLGGRRSITFSEQRLCWHCLA